MRGARDESGATGTTGGPSNVHPEEPGNAENSSQGAANGSHSDVAGASITQPTIPDDLSERSARTAPPPNQGFLRTISTQSPNNRLYLM